MPETSWIDPRRVEELEAAETARFVADRPGSMALLDRARASMPRGVPMAWMDDLYEHPPVMVDRGEGAHFTDVDGHTYLDMYLGDMSSFCGHAPAPVVEAVSRRMELGNHFLLPGEDAIAVAEHLAERYGPPEVAVHPVGHASEHRGDPPRPRGHGARDRPGVRREVPRPHRVHDGRPRGRPPGPRGAGPALVGHRPGPHRRVQRRRCARRGARARRCGRGHDGAGHDERRHPGTGTGLPPGAPPAHARCGNLARHRRDPHARRSLWRAHDRARARARCPHGGQVDRRRRPPRRVRDDRCARGPHRPARGVLARDGHGGG